MTITANFLLGGTDYTDRGYVATTGGTVALALEDALSTDVKSAVVRLVSSSKNATAITELDVDAPGFAMDPPSGGMNLTIPDEVGSWTIEVQINGGVSARGVEAAWTRTRIISTVGSSGVTKTCPAERDEYDPEAGWTAAQNAMVNVVDELSGALGSSGGDVDFNSTTGVFNFKRAGTTGLVFTVDPTGAISLAPVATASGFTIQPSQVAGGTGIRVVIGGGAGGTPGTNLAGGFDIDQGTTVASASAPTRFLASGSAYMTIARHVSYPGGLIQSTSLPGFQGASGAIIGSNDDSVRAYFNQGDQSITLTSSFVENSGQYSGAINKIAVAATVNINWNLSNTVWIGATAATKITTNVTVAAPTNPREGNMLYGVRAVSNGANTLTWNAIFTFPAAGTGINQWAAGVPADTKVTWHWFAWNGTAYECVASSII